MSGPALIRPFQPGDRAALASIAYQTGFFGRSARVYFPARRLFEVLWMGAYFHCRGQPGAAQSVVGYVAEAGGEVVGYVVGSTSHAAYQCGLLRALRSDLWGALWPPGDVARSLPYLLRAARFAAPHASWQAYPAHLHINLLPAARGQKLGERLLEAYLARLQALGVPGVQLSTTAENRAALALYRKHGFEVLATRKTPLWTPWLGHSAEQVVMGRRLTEPEAAAGG